MVLKCFCSFRWRSGVEYNWISLVLFYFWGLFIYSFICLFYCREFFYSFFLIFFFVLNRIPPIYFSFSAFSTFLKISFRCLLFYFPRSCKRLFIYLFYIFISFLLSFCSGSAFVFFHGILFKTSIFFLSLFLLFCLSFLFILGIFCIASNSYSEIINKVFFIFFSLLL